MSDEPVSPARDANTLNDVHDDLEGKDEEIKKETERAV